MSDIEGVIATVHEGEISFKDVSITAIRGPQSGIYAVVTSGFGDKEKGIIGCGVYGYDYDEWQGVTQESVQFLQDFISKPTHTPTVNEAIQKLRDMNAWNERDEAGRERCIKLFTKPEYQFHGKVREVQLSGATRFNQGDAFFAKNLAGINQEQASEIVSTKPGKADKSLLSQMGYFVKKAGL